jgi:hypothetical protein
MSCSGLPIRRSSSCGSTGAGVSSIGRQHESRIRSGSRPASRAQRRTWSNRAASSRGVILTKCGNPALPYRAARCWARVPLVADPDGDARLLQRLRREAHLAEAIVPAFKARLLVSPEPAQDLELLIGHGPALLEVGPQRVKLLDHPSYAPAPGSAAPARDGRHIAVRRRSLGASLLTAAAGIRPVPTTTARNS